MADLVLAVDIGGTKMAAGLVALGRIPGRTGDAADPAVVGPGGMATAMARMPTGPRAAELLWGDLAALVERVAAAAGSGDRLVVCGAGCGGPMSPGGDEVSPLNIEAWRSFPLRARLAELTGLPDVRRQRRPGARPR